MDYGQFENGESGQYTLVIAALKDVNCKLTKLYLDANGIGILSLNSPIFP